MQLRIDIADSPFKIHRYRPTKEDREFPYLLSASEGLGETSAGHRGSEGRAQEGFPSRYSNGEGEEESEGYTLPSTGDYETGYGADGDSSPSRNPFYSPEDRMVSREAQESSPSLYSTKKKGKSRGENSLAAGNCETRYRTGGDSSPSRNPFYSPEDRMVSEEAQEGSPSPYSIKKKKKGSKGVRPHAIADCKTRYENPFYSPEDRMASHEAESFEEELSTSPVAHSMPKKKVWQQPGQYGARGQGSHPANWEKAPTQIVKSIQGGTRGATDGMMRDSYTARRTGDSGGTDDDIDELQMDLPGTRIQVKRQ